MDKSGRSSIAAFMACTILLLFTAKAYPSYNTEAGHKYTIACQRLADLKKAQKKKKYRSYWMDCIRTFELVEKKYPKSPSAADACFDRASLYLELYQFSKYPRDLDESIHVYQRCQAAYPNHVKAPEALYRVIDLSLDNRKNGSLASKTYNKLTEVYPDNIWTDRARTRLGLFVSKQKREPEIKKMPVPVLASQGKTKPAGVVQKIRYWSGGAYTRIVIEQNRSVRFQAQELKNPDRLVFDILNTRVSDSIDKDPLPVNDGILKQVRASQYAPDIVRVVLDLASIKSYAAFPLHDPERLVIDVTGEGGIAAEPQITSIESGTQPQQENPGEPNTATSSEFNAEPNEVPKAESRAKPSPEPYSQTTPPVQVPAVKNNDEKKLSLSRQMGLKIRTIAIDAGHGGHDPGAIGKNGLKEKTVTLDIAKRLSVLVKERLGCEVIMTRDHDVFIPLDQRPFIAKSRGADLFVSIHVNANRKRKARGIETYIQGLQASDREAMATAARENAMSTKRLSELDSEIDKILKDLKQDNKLEESLQLAHTVQSSLVGTIRPEQKQVMNLGVKRAFFYVLINTQMPSILAEVGFISNPDEEKQLRKDSYRQSIAEALYQGVKKYVDARSPQMIGI
jgi:N-acetylmuramoyl-L-alanine amidase